MQLRFGIFRALDRRSRLPADFSRVGPDPAPRARKPHDRLGHVFVDPSGTPPVEEIEQAIRTEAARLGADAAVVVYDRTRRIGRVYEGPWWDRRTYPVFGRKIVAVAIRYRVERERE